MIYAKGHRQAVDRLRCLWRDINFSVQWLNCGASINFSWRSFKEFNSKKLFGKNLKDSGFRGMADPVVFVLQVLLSANAHSRGLRGSFFGCLAITGQVSSAVLSVEHRAELMPLSVAVSIMKLPMSD